MRVRVPALKTLLKLPEDVTPDRFIGGTACREVQPLNMLFVIVIAAVLLGNKGTACSELQVLNMLLTSLSAAMLTGNDGIFCSE